MCDRAGYRTLRWSTHEEGKMTRTKRFAATLAAGAVAATVAVLPAQGGEATSARKLTFTSIERKGDERVIDLGRQGPSVGDRWLLASTLQQDGKRAGRLEADCVGIDKRFGVLQCSVVVILAEGQLTLQGVQIMKRIPGVTAAAEEYSITGGTGAYTGATGSMRRAGNDEPDTLTFTLE
jgi:hypothetical protein